MVRPYIKGVKYTAKELGLTFVVMGVGGDGRGQKLVGKPWH